MADIPHIIFSSYDAVVHSQATIDANPYVRRHIQTYYGGVLEAETHAMIERINPGWLKYVKPGQNND